MVAARSHRRGARVDPRHHHGAQRSRPPGRPAGDGGHLTDPRRGALASGDAPRTRRCASGSRPAPRGRCTSGPRGPRCSTSCMLATRGARSSSGSRTPTSPEHRGVRARHPRRAALAGHHLGRGTGRRRGGGRRAVRALPPDAAPRALRGGGRPAARGGPRYPCYCTPEELDADRKAQEAREAAAALRGPVCPPDAGRARGARGRGPQAGALRFRVREGVVAFDDLVRGRVEIDTANLGGDFVIVRADGTPLYHFTVVVDDAAMRISTSSAARITSQHAQAHPAVRALGYDVPAFAHLPLILNPDRSKMSKRKTQTAVADYRDQGFMPEALVNYLALLGWSTGHRGGDLLAGRARRSASSSRRSTRAARCFDRERLEWLNGQWIRRLDDDDLVERLHAVPGGAASSRPASIGSPTDEEEVRALLPVIRERLPTLPRSGPGRVPVGRPSCTSTPAMLVPEALGRATTLRRLTPRGRRSPPSTRSPGRRTSWRRRSGRWPRRAAGRPATCSWPSASPTRA